MFDLYIVYRGSDLTSGTPPYLGVKPAEWGEAIQEVEAHSDHLQL